MAAIRRAFSADIDDTADRAIAIAHGIGAAYNFNALYLIEWNAGEIRAA